MYVVSIVACVYMIWMLLLFIVVLRLCWIRKNYRVMDCRFIATSVNPCLQDFSQEHPKLPEEQFLIYDYEEDGKKFTQYSKFKYHNAVKHIYETSKIFVHKKDITKTYLYQDLRRLNRYLPKCISNSILLYFVFLLIWSIIALYGFYM